MLTKVWFKTGVSFGQVETNAGDWVLRVIPQMESACKFDFPKLYVISISVIYKVDSFQIVFKMDSV